jgi:hypothetical protein
MSTVQAVEFQGQLGTLRGMFHRPARLADGGHFPVVMLLHGFSGHHVEDHRLYVQFARCLADAGFAALRFDFYGSGDSDGDFEEFTVLSELCDAVIALDWIGQQPGIDTRRIGVVGLSLGGGVTALLAGQDSRVKAAVFWNSVARPSLHFDEIPTEGPLTGVVGGLRIGPDFVPTYKAQDFLGSLGRYSGPGLVIWGTGDEYISRADADALHAALGERGTLHLIEGADHTFRRPDWRQELFEITSRWLVDHLK